MKAILRISIPAILLVAAASAPAAQLSTDARTAIPHDVQQLVAIDYHAMENSPSAMNLRERVMPPELKRFEDALRKSGLNENHDVESLAFALFRPKADGDQLNTVGVAQGQFSVTDITANFRKQQVKSKLVRTNRVWPLAKTGMVVCFVDPSTMVFGDEDAVYKALDARDGLAPNLLTNGPMMDAMKAVDSEPLWSIIDQKGTQTMMKQVLGEAGSLTDFETVQKQLVGLLVLDELSARRQIRPHHLNRRQLCRGHALFALVGRAGGAQDERIGCRETGVERHLHLLRLRAAVDPLRHLRCGVQQPLAIPALQGHCALEKYFVDSIRRT